MIETNDATQIKNYEDKLAFLRKQVLANGYNEDNLRVVITCNMFPKNGVILPAGKESYIYRNPNCSLGIVVRDRIKKVDGINEYDDEKLKTLKLQSEKYMPYSTKYVSVVYGAINGLYADYFATNFIIIDKFKNFANPTNILSLKPETTLFQGELHLSSDAVILVNNRKYEALKRDYPELSRFKVRNYEGDPEKALAMYLVEDNVVPERLTRDFVMDSPTSEMFIEYVSNYAVNNNIGTLRYDETNFFREDQDKTGKLASIYDAAFYSFLLKKVNVPESHYDELFKRLCEGDSYDADNLVILDGIIESIGASGILSIVNEFNSKIESKIKSGNYPTNDELLELGKIELD